MKKQNANPQIKKTEGKCCICGNGPTVISHLLPKALALDTKGSSKNIKVGSISKTGHEHLEGGFFDKNLLCSIHEKMLHPFDDYAVDFCRTFETKQRALENQRFRIPNVNTDLLVRFAVSVVWRFSVSKVRIFHPVELGPYQDHFRAIVFDNAPCAPDPALMIRAYKSSRWNVKGIIAAPTEFEILNLRFFSFTISGISFVLKADDRLLAATADLPVINGLDYVDSGYKLLDDSAELRQFREIAVNMTKPPARPHQK
jgi:hypothetical protein